MFRVAKQSYRLFIASANSISFVATSVLSASLLVQYVIYLQMFS